MGVILEELLHSIRVYAAKGGIAVLLPILWMQGDKGQQIDGRFKYEKVWACPRPMKGVSVISVLLIDPESRALLAGDGAP